MRKGVNDVLRYIKNAVLNDEAKGMAENNYKPLLKFIDVAYSSTTLSNEKNILTKIDNDTYKKVCDMLVKICENISYDKFSCWIKNNHSPNSLYCINAENYKDKLLQIGFYIDIRNLMLEIYKSYHGEITSRVLELHHNSMEIYKLLKKEAAICTDEPCDQDSTPEQDKNFVATQELIKKFDKLEANKPEKSLNVSHYKYIEEMYDMLSEILSRNDVPNYLRKKYIARQREMRLELLKKEREGKTRIVYTEQAKKDIKDENIANRLWEDPEYVDFVQRCQRECKLNPQKDIESIMKEVQEKVMDEFNEKDDGEDLSNIKSYDLIYRLKTLERRNKEKDASDLYCKNLEEMYEIIEELLLREGIADKKMYIKWQKELHLELMKLKVKNVMDKGKDSSI